jgi:hypothetical protein
MLQSSSSGRMRRKKVAARLEVSHHYIQRETHTGPHPHLALFTLRMVAAMWASPKGWKTLAQDAAKPRQPKVYLLRNFLIDRGSFRCILCFAFMNHNILYQGYPTSDTYQMATL